MPPPSDNGTYKDTEQIQDKEKEKEENKKNKKKNLNTYKPPKPSDPKTELSMPNLKTNSYKTEFTLVFPPDPDNPEELMDISSKEKKENFMPEKSKTKENDLIFNDQ